MEKKNKDNANYPERAAGFIDEDFTAMSEYSLDSLDNVEKDCSEKCILVNNNNDDNLEIVKSTDKFVKNNPFYLNPKSMTSLPIKDNTAKANGTVRGDRCASTTGGRNSIIASGRGFARRRQECRAARDEPWLCIRKRNDAVVVVEGQREEESDANRRRTSRQTTATATATATTTTERCSPGTRNSSSKCSLHNSGGDMRADKKLGNVLAPWIRDPIRTTSYSELYRCRFNIPRYSRIRSPEGSTLSICGDSQLEELSLDEGRSSLPGTSRDDSSELSFYRRFVEGHAARATRTTRSCEISRREIPSNTVFPGVHCERSVSDSKLKKSTYRPYTIEEYRSLSVPRPDRSLGPNRDEVQAKREWLMRRRSYGDSVSARNREQILQRARRLKDRENLRIPETDDVTQESLLKRSVRYSKKRVTTGEVSPFRGMLEKTPIFGSPLVSYAEDPYLTTSQDCHLQEMELADRLMRQALNS